MLYINKPKNFNPQFVVVSCFLELNNKILLLHRQDNKPEGNTWGVPAGKLKQMEDIHQAILRETKEETGVILEDPEYFKEVYVSYPDYDFTYHIFHKELQEDQDITINEKEHKDFKWIKPKQALEMELIEDLDRCINLFYTL